MLEFVGAITLISVLPYAIVVAVLVPISLVIMIGELIAWAFGLPPLDPELGYRCS